MTVFFLLQAASPQEILKAFHGTLTIPPYFIHLFVLSNYSKRKHQAQIQN